MRRLIGYVPQQLSAEGALTGRENVALFARLFDVPRARARSQVVEEVLELDGPHRRRRPAGRRPTPAAWCAGWSWRRRW